MHIYSKQAWIQKGEWTLKPWKVKINKNVVLVFLGYVITFTTLQQETGQ